MTEVTLVPLAPDDRNQFILDNQEAFNYGALEELEYVSGRLLEDCDGIRIPLEKFTCPMSQSKWWKLLCAAAKTA